MSILYGLDVKFPHQREIKGGGSGQELAPEREKHELRGGVRAVRYLTLMADCPSAPNQPGSEPDKNTFHPLADVSNLRWVAKSSSSSSQIKEVGHSFKVEAIDHLSD